MYVIKNIVNQLYWSNDHGWGDFDGSTYFSAREQQEFNLPLEGSWLSLWEVDVIQFARLISELRATGADTEEAMATLQESMDLDYDEVESIFQRAEEVWETSKAKLNLSGPHKSYLLNVSNEDLERQIKTLSGLLQHLNNAQYEETVGALRLLEEIRDYRHD